MPWFRPIYDFLEKSVHDQRWSFRHHSGHFINCNAADTKVILLHIVCGGQKNFSLRIKRFACVKNFEIRFKLSFP